MCDKHELPGMRKASKNGATPMASDARGPSLGAMMCACRCGAFLPWHR